MSDEYELVRSDRVARCKWCGTAESKKWVNVRGGIYCSFRCEAANESMQLCAGTLCFSMLLLGSGRLLGTVFLEFAVLIGLPLMFFCMLSVYGFSAMLSVPKNSRRSATKASAEVRTPPTPVPSADIATDDLRLIAGTEWHPVPIEIAQFDALTAALARVETTFRVFGVSFTVLSKRAALLVRNMNLHTALDQTEMSEGQSKQRLVGWGSSSERSYVHLGLEIVVTGVTAGVRCLCRVSAFSETEETAQSTVKYVETALAGTAEPAPPVRYLTQAAPRVPRPSSDSKTVVRSTRTPPAIREIHIQQKVGQRITILVQSEQREDCLRLAARVTNESEQPISNVDAFLISYPSASLSLTTDDSMCAPEVAAGSHQDSMFVLEPTREFAHGEIVAGVSYVGADGVSHTVAADPIPVPVLKGMLRPEPMTKDDFAKLWTDMENGEMTIKVEEWTPEELHEKASAVLRGLGFSEIESHIETSESLVMAEVSGSARGKYAGKRLLVTVVVHGISRRLDSSCSLTVAAEDESLILPAMAVVKDLLEAWLCPYCSARLVPGEIQKLKSARGAACTSCRRALDIKSFWKDRY